MRFQGRIIRNEALEPTKQQIDDSHPANKSDLPSSNKVTLSYAWPP